MEKYLEYFIEFSKIPHGSGNTKMISDYLVSFAQEHNLEYIQDDLNNVIIFKDASAGYEKQEPIILQGHMDMVAVKEKDCNKDMSSEGLDICIEGNTLYAKGTSLGGDDGIAVAYMLAILAGNYKHPRLECIITVDEETGMYGAKGINVDSIKSKRMINIDNEEEGNFIVGCAGGSRVGLKVEASKSRAEGYLYEISLGGLTGGHSGEEIDKHRGNAVKLLNYELCKLKEEVKLCKHDAEMRIVEIEGGTADNVIPSSAIAKVMLTYKSNKISDVMSNDDTEFNVNAMINSESIREYMKECDIADSATLEVKSLGWNNVLAYDFNATNRLIELIESLPNGVISMDKVNPKFVETSLNIGILREHEDGIYIEILARSSVEDSMKQLLEKLCKLSKTTSINGVNTTYELLSTYPGWQYAEISPLRESMVKVYEKINLCKPNVNVIHAGLECGLFQDKIKGLDCVSIGPDLKDIHSPKETLYLDSSKRVFDYIVRFLETLVC